MQWSAATLSTSPFHEAGRFVGHPGDLLSHRWSEASPDAELAPHPYERLPRYSSEPAPALRAAERAGLFAGGGTVLSCTPAGRWRLAAVSGEVEMEDDCLPRLLCRAALRLAGGDAGCDGP